MKLQSYLRILFLSVLLAGLMWGSAPVQHASAASLVVDSLVDAAVANDGACTFREALINANNDNQSGSTDCAAGTGADTITFSLSGTVGLYTFLPNVTDVDGLTVDGSGQTVTISGSSVWWVFYLGPSARLDLLNLTVANGYNDNYGGAVYNDGIVTLTNVTISNNYASKEGGGVYINSGDSLTVTDCAFSTNGATISGGAIRNNNGTFTVTGTKFNDNSAADGGAIHTTSSGATVMTVTNSSFSRNYATTKAGGAINSNGPMTVTNATFSGNNGSAQGGAVYNNGNPMTLTNGTFYNNGAGFGASVFNQGSNTFTLKNSILSSPSTGSHCYNTITDGGNNIEDGTSCNFNSSLGSLSSTAANLGSLTGNPPYFPLSSNSPAIDKVTYNAPNGCSAADQRGQSRTDYFCDSGAVEMKITDLHKVTKAISTAGLYTFGPTMVTVNVVTPGTLSTLSVQQVDANHPSASPQLLTGYYWTLTPSNGASDFNTDLTLPVTTFTPDEFDKVCRWVVDVGWDCAMTSYTASTITRAGVTAFSDWTTGNDADPTAIRLRSLEARNAAPAGWLLAGFAGVSLLYLFRKRIRSSG